MIILVCMLVVMLCIDGLLFILYRLGTYVKDFLTMTRNPPSNPASTQYFVHIISVWFLRLGQGWKATASNSVSYPAAVPG